MKPCPCCHFNDGLNEEATVAQNYGCLPTKWDMMDILQQQGLALSCHDQQDRHCIGLAMIRDTREVTVWPYSMWYKGLQPIGCKEKV